MWLCVCDMEMYRKAGVQKNVNLWFKMHGLIVAIVTQTKQIRNSSQRDNTVVWHYSTLLYRVIIVINNGCLRMRYFIEFDWGSLGLYNFVRMLSMERPLCVHWQNDGFCHFRHTNWEWEREIVLLWLNASQIIIYTRVEGRRWCGRHITECSNIFYCIILCSNACSRDEHKYITQFRHCGTLDIIYIIMCVCLCFVYTFDLVQSYPKL